MHSFSRFFLPVLFALGMAQTLAEAQTQAQGQSPAQVQVQAQPQPQPPFPGNRFPLPPESWPNPVMDDQLVPYLLLDRLEYRWQKGSNLRVWDAQAWFGGDYNKLWLKSEGEQAVGGRTEAADLQLLYARLIAPFWYLQVGVRNAARPGPSQNSAVLAIQGIAPYEFDVEGSLFLRAGKVSGRFEGEYDQPITQRLILQPSFETNFAGSSDRERGIGSGINDLELGLRLRYEIRREFAPYIGIYWSRKLGGTADIARSNGERVSDRGIVVGLRIWY